MPAREFVLSTQKIREVAGKAAWKAACPVYSLTPADVPPETKSALLVSPLSEDHQFLDQLFREEDWKLRTTRTLGSALSVLREHQIPLVISERDLPLGDWKDLLAAIHQLSYNPLLVVTSRVADEYLWAEVLNLGGHDVVAKPFQAAELHWVLQSAWCIWANREGQVMDSGAVTMGAGAV